MGSQHGGHASTRRLVLLATIVTFLLSLASGVWAMPNQRGLRQTVPTRTPTKPPDTSTPVPPTNTPAPPPTATPEPPPTATPEPQPMPQETATLEEPTPEPPTATPTKGEKSAPQPTPTPQVMPPTPAPTEAAPQAVSEAQAQLTATAEAITSAGYAETGGNYGPLLVGGGFLMAVLAFTVGYVLRRRLASGSR